MIQTKCQAVSSLKKTAKKSESPLLRSPLALLLNGETQDFRKLLSLLPLPLSGLIKQATNWWHFSLFQKKTGFDISCKLSPKETICMKCQILFFRKNKKNISNCLLLKIFPRVKTFWRQWKSGKDKIATLFSLFARFVISCPYFNVNGYTKFLPRVTTCRQEAASLISETTQSGLLLTEITCSQIEGASSFLQM